MYYIGIDLGGTNIAVGLVDENGNILKKESIKTKKGVKYTEIIRDMAELSKKIIKDFGIKEKDVKHIGIGLPGIADNKNGVVVRLVNLNFDNVPVRDEMKKYFDLPIYIENDANCAAIAEGRFGAAKGCKNSVMITLGTGIGGGVIIDEKIFTGFNCAGGELGHISLIINGELCGCGRRGCWETYASATALKKQAINAVKKDKNTLIYRMVNGDIDKIESRLVFECAKKGDLLAKKIIDQYIEYLGEGIINIVNIFQPEVLSIGGGVCKSGDYFLNKLKEMVQSKEMARDLEKRVDIKIAETGNDAGIIGAAFISV